MSDYVAKANTKPQPLRSTLRDGTGTIVNLDTAATVNLLMREPYATTPLIDAAGTFVSPRTSGQVEYQFEENQLIAGRYWVEWLVTWADGHKDRFPIDDERGYLEVLIYGSLE